MKKSKRYIKKLNKTPLINKRVMNYIINNSNICKHAIRELKLAGYTPNVEIKVKIVGLRPGEKLYEELLNDTAKTLPTHHEKIMIAQEPMHDFEKLNIDMDDLIAEANKYSINEVVLKMKEIVPEFISMNSDFVLLDK